MHSLSKKIFCFTILFVFFLILISAFAPQTTHGQRGTYAPLAPIKSGTTEFVGTSVPTNDLTKYFNDMFRLGIAIAVALAVVMIIIGGVEYMSSDAIGKKEDGQGRINAALLGLVVALGSYMLLNTIDPDLLNTRLKLDHRIEGTRLPGSLGAVTLEETDTDGTKYTYYEYGNIRATYPDGTTENFDRENGENGEPPNPQTNPPGRPLPEYNQEGCTEMTDNGGHKTLINAESAYLRDNMSSFVPGSIVYSTSRSKRHNANIRGAAADSQHTHGGAVDISDTSSRGRDGTVMNPAIANQTINYIKQNADQLGAYKIIFNNVLYTRGSNGQWTSKSGKYGHFNHVHVSLGEFCQ